MAARSSQRGVSCLTRAPTFIQILATAKPPLRPSRTFLQSTSATASSARLRYFSSSFDGSSLPSTTASSTPKPHANSQAQENQNGPITTAGEESATEAEPRLSSAGSADPDGAASSSSSTPWYLDVEPPRHPTLVPHQAPLPPAPEDSPALTEPLIKFVGEELGLDDLTLLDLRSLDPPAALGPKLIMMFGTARSERHLHVSADRLVRWLRQRGVTAHADGLLGRNELKTKMRRRARRAKLVGDSTFDKGDDGISTGWVCVNLGTLGWTVEPAGEATMLDAEGRPSGFGQPIIGTTMVVQMLTEGKREELGLERLWNGVLKKSNRDREAIEAAADDTLASMRQGSPRKASGQRRDAFADFNPAQASRYSTTTRPATPVSMEELFTSDRTGFFHELSYNPERKQEFLSKITSLLESSIALTRKEWAQLATLVDLTTSNLPPTQTWSFRVAVATKAVQASSTRKGDLLANLRNLVSEMKTTGAALARQDALRLLHALFASFPNKSKASPASQLHERAELAADLLQTMHERGMHVLANDVVTSLQRGLARAVALDERPSRGAKTTQPQQTTPRSLRDSLEDLRSHSGLPCPPEEDIIALMEARSDAGDFAGFWDAWRLPSRYGAPRSPNLYWWLFRHATKLGRPDVALEAVRTAIPQALAERPHPVQLRGTLARAIRDCLLVVDPRGQARQAGAGTSEKHKPNAEVVRVMEMLEI